MVDLKWWPSPYGAEDQIGMLESSSGIVAAALRAASTVSPEKVATPSPSHLR